MSTQAVGDPKRRGRITQDERARIVDLIESGEHGCGEIATIVGRDKSVVSRIAAAEGLDFERSQTRAATAAKQADVQARLADIADRLVTEIDRFIDDLHKRTLVYSFGGRENSYNEHEIPEPDFRAKQAIMTSIGIGTDKVLAIRKAEAGPGEATGLIIDLVSAIRESA